MDDTLIICFAKEPGSSQAKTRLASTIGAKLAEDFYRMSCESIFETLRECTTFSGFKCVLASDEDRPIAADIPHFYQGGGTFADRINRAFNHFSETTRNIIIIGTDTPQLSSETICNAAKSLSPSKPGILGPTHDGGFYLFGTQKKLAQDFWTGLPFSGLNMAEETMKKFSGAFEQLPKLTDADYEDDLPKLYSELSQLERLHRYQRELLDWLQQSQLLQFSV